MPGIRYYVDFSASINGTVHKIWVLIAPLSGEAHASLLYADTQSIGEFVCR